MLSVAFQVTVSNASDVTMDLSQMTQVRLQDVLSVLLAGYRERIQTTSAQNVRMVRIQQAKVHVACVKLASSTTAPLILVERAWMNMVSGMK